MQCNIGKYLKDFRLSGHIQSPLLDGMSLKFSKDCTKVLALPLRNLVNLSIKQKSLFPDQFTIVKLKPLFKRL